MRYVYLLELHEGSHPVNVGIFTSLTKAQSFLKSLPKKFAYAVYKLPVNTKLTKGRKLEDQQGTYDHWHYGTQEGVRYWEVTEDGELVDDGIRTEFNWPD